MYVKVQYMTNMAQRLGGEKWRYRIINFLSYTLSSIKSFKGGYDKLGVYYKSCRNH